MGKIKGAVLMQGIFTSGIIAALGFGAFLTGELVMGYVAPQPEERVLILAQFSYSDGLVTQQVVSRSGRPIAAPWATQISRPVNGGLQVVCGGGSQPGKPGIYNGDVDVYSLDDWTGDDCPDRLEDGDRLEVVWEYENEYSLKQSVGGTIVVGQTQQVTP